MEKEYNELHDELRPEYDETVLKNGIRGKYVKRYQEKTNSGGTFAPDLIPTNISCGQTAVSFT